MKHFITVVLRPPLSDLERDLESRLKGKVFRKSYRTGSYRWL